MKLSNFQILKVLIRAKRTYKNRSKRRIFIGMCANITKAFYDLYDGHIVYYDDIQLFIPEFNFTNLNNSKKLASGYWWPTYDKKSRIKAFNKLIKLYIFKTIFQWN